MVVVHLVATLYMTGLIWFVQIVHYPLMAWVGPERFSAYAQRHQKQTTWLVLPVMLLELGTGLALVYVSLDQQSWSGPAWAGAALLAVIWGMTLLVHVPQHVRLLQGYNPALIRQLVLTNSVRAVAWTIRSGLALWFLLDLLAK